MSETKSPEPDTVCCQAGIEGRTAARTDRVRRRWNESGKYFADQFWVSETPREKVFDERRA